MYSKGNFELKMLKISDDHKLISTRSSLKLTKIKFKFLLCVSIFNQNPNEFHLNEISISGL